MAQIILSKEKKISYTLGLNKYQVVAVFLVEILLFSGLAVFAVFYQSSEEVFNIQNWQEAHIIYCYDFDGNKDVNGLSDVVIDLTIKYYQGTILVDNLVEVSGLALIDNNAVPSKLGRVNAVLVDFPNWLVFPVTFDENNITKPGTLRLEATENNSKLWGYAKVTWSLEGSYTPIFTLVCTNETGTQTLDIGASENYVSIHSKSESISIIESKILLAICVILYFILVIVCTAVVAKFWYKKLTKEKK